MSNSLFLSSVSRNSILFLTLPLLLSAFTHLWNPIGFPRVLPDETGYLQRAMHVLQGKGPQIQTSPLIPAYDHPYFGQIFVGAMLYIVGYPGLYISHNTVQSVETLYLLPRLLVGLLAVADTFLIFKIAERRYGLLIAFLSSLLFAVMPLSLMIRWVLLDSIQLPFLLLAILFSMYYGENDGKNRKTMKTFLSGFFLGVAIFTKIPALTMIPLVGFLIFRNNGNRFRPLAIWIIPVCLVPLIWPAYAASLNQFNLWLSGTFMQTHRGAHVLINSVLPRLATSTFMADPILTILGSIGLILAVIRRDYVLILWIIPYLFFFSFLDTLQSIYIIPIIPAICISASKLIKEVIDKASRKGHKIVIQFFLIFGIAVSGLLVTTITIVHNTNSPIFNATAFIIDLLKVNKGTPTTVVSYQVFSWIPQFIYQEREPFINYYDGILPKTQRVLILSDWALAHSVAARLPAAVQIENKYHLNNATKLANFEDKNTGVPVSIYEVFPAAR